MNADTLALEAQTKGWLHPGEGEALHKWALRSTGPILEIGSYCGKSTIWLGTAAKETGQPMVSIDWHRGNPEMRPGSECFDADVWDAELGATDTIPHLRRTMHRAGLERTVSLICATSEQAWQWWSTPLGFLFIDADHGTAAIEDVHRWDRHIPTGVLCMHDADGGIPAVMAACATAESYGWVLQEQVRSLRVYTR